MHKIYEVHRGVYFFDDLMKIKKLDIKRYLLVLFDTFYTKKSFIFPNLAN